MVRVVIHYSICAITLHLWRVDIARFMMSMWLILMMSDVMVTTSWCTVVSYYFVKRYHDVAVLCELLLSSPFREYPPPFPSRAFFTDGILLPIHIRNPMLNS